jgi:predicted CxxxxCH...CXXCH cytochrome family protein
MAHCRTLSLIAAASAALAAAGCGDAARIPPIPATGGAVALDACTRCHGDPANGNAAPPRSVHGDTDTAAVGVGAHQAHLTDSKIRQALACADCHTVPAQPDSPGHIVGDHAVLTFGDLAQKRGAKPTFDRSSATCSSVYCHGATLGDGGTNHTPQWTKVDGTQAACGTCHDLPPKNGRHPVLDSAPGDTTACAKCHVETVKPDGTIDVAGGKHIDGRVEVAGAGCTACHGDAKRPAVAGADARFPAAPPMDTSGNTSTSSLGVGAHQAHVAGGPLTAPIACASCHVVPPSTDNHPLGVNDADKVTFSGLATSDSASPTWNPVTASCSATYCHGSTLNAGGTSHAPTWTKVDGTQAACGTCHSIPPPPETGHVQSTSCGSCHTGYTSTSVNVATHVNGVVDVNGMTCTSCHGDANRAAAAGADAKVKAAPPMSTRGETATTARGVGAHQSHVNPPAGALTAPLACSECHVVPDHIPHSNGVVDIKFGAKASSDGAAPAWNGATCSNVYCHGSTLNAGGTNHQPTWTKVDGTQAACGSCHSIPPPPETGHVQSTACGSCHTGYTSTSVNPALHVNGTVDVGNMTCTSCHGDSTRTAAPGADPLVKAAPPMDTRGQTSSNAVGAHQAHVNKASGITNPIQCSECHAVPNHIPHSNGTVDIQFGGRAVAGGAAPAWNATNLTCASTYCHGNFPNGNRTTMTWNKPGTTCTTCHGAPPSTGQHSRHVNQGIACSQCHGTGYSSTTVNRDTHVNGTIDVTNRVTSWNPSTGACVGCHGANNWFNPSGG